MIELSHIIVGYSVKEEAIAERIDNNLLETARIKLVEAAKSEGIELNQIYAKERQLLGYKVVRYACACQFKFLNKAIKRQSAIMSKVNSEIAHKMTTLCTR